MFEVGSRVKLESFCKYTKEKWGFHCGDTGTVTDNITFLEVTMDVTRNGYTKLYFAETEYNQLNRATPPQKITQNGYEYKLVGPVNPKWLVDGVWVVRKDNGETHQIKHQSENMFSATSSLSRVTGITLKRVSDEFRPHTSSDWKWGDWAMYGNERVFVIRLVLRAPVLLQDGVLIQLLSMRLYLN